jgi:hypothetical protein
MGPSYDAVYAIALALVGKSDIGAASMVAGLPTLSTNTQTCAYDGTFVESPCFSVTDHGRTLYDSMGALLQAKKITEIGTAGRLEWDAQGSKSSGSIEVWCIDGTNPPKPKFASSGLSYDIKTQNTSGSYTDCAPGGLP